MRQTAALAAIAAILLVSGNPAWAASSAVQIDQLGQQRTAPSSAAQVAQPSGQGPRSGAVTVQSTAPAQTGAAAANVSQARARGALGAWVQRGQARPIQGLDCSAGELAALQQQLQAEDALRPKQNLDVNGIDNSIGNTIDSIGRQPNPADAFNGAPPIVILGTH